MATAPAPKFYATPGREPSEVLGRAFAEGCGGGFVESRIMQPGPCAFYGCSKYTVNVMKTAAGRGTDYYYLDNGYFHPGHYDGYYRVTRNAEQMTSVPADMTPEQWGRWDRLGQTLKPWRRSGAHILVIGQSRTYFELRGIRPGTWLWETVAELGRVTDRPLIVRPKPTARTQRRPLEADLAGAWAVVTYSSNVAVEAVVAGIPAVVLGTAAAAPVSTALEQIETPEHPDRERWVRWLAANQWTLEEIRNGTCWRHLEADRRHLAA